MLTNINPFAIAAAGVAAFLLSGAYYGLLGDRLAQLAPAYAEAGGMAPTTIALELVRSLVVAVVVAGLATGLDVAGLGPALLLAAVLWVAFPGVLLFGSVLHEGVPALLAAIHAGDWLLKLIAITAVVGLWP